MPHFAIEINRHRCQTLRRNHPGLHVFEGPIQALTLSDYPTDHPIIFYFVTFPCDHYTLAANIHQTWTGDALYLEALREIVLHYPECIAIENVWGFKRFKRAIESFRSLPLYYCTEFVAYGEDFTLQRKKRVFLLLHRQPFSFAPLEHYAPSRPTLRLHDYLEHAVPPPPIPPYVYTRLDGKYRDRPIIYSPHRQEPVNLFTNYRRDRSLFLVEDPRCPRGVRPFSVREVANLHGFDSQYHFFGPLGEAYDMVVDSVMPPVAEAIGRAVNAYIASIPRLADVPRALGHREVISQRQREEDREEALHLLREPEPLDARSVEQIALW